VEVAAVTNTLAYYKKEKTFTPLTPSACILKHIAIVIDSLP
jgi:hypothetical protein